MSKFHFFLIGGIFCLSAFLLLWKLDGVDIEGSEDIYISDAIGYMRGDLYMVPRHHLRKPHYPASPHPFLYQLLMIELFKTTGLSVFSSRLVSVWSTILTGLIVTLLGWLIFKSIKIASFSGLLFFSSPLVIRFGRMAILDPLLMCVQAIGAVFVWKFLVSQRYSSLLFAGFSGLVYGLSISTKLSGVFYILLFISVWFWKLLTLKIDRKIHVLSLLVFFISSGFIFYFFNDPASYIYGWLNFSDPKYKNISPVAFVKGIIAIKYWYVFVAGLLGIVQFVLIVLSVRFIGRFWLSRKKVFLMSWVLVPISYLLLNPPHVTGLSSEWAYLPLMPPLSILTGWSLHGLLKGVSTMFKYVITLLCGFIIGIPLVLFGLRLYPLPLPNLLLGRNVVVGDLAVTRIVTTLNQDKRQVRVLLVLKGVIMPLWLLNNNITTEPRYHKLAEYEYIVTDNQKLIDEASGQFFSALRREKNPTEVEVVLLKKGDQQ